MTEKNKRFSRLMFGFTIAFIISEVIRSVSGFNYNLVTDGLDFRILIDILIFAVPLIVADSILYKLFFNTDNKK